MVISTHFETIGFNADVESEFGKYYLGIEPSDLVQIDLLIEFKIKFKLFAFFSPIGWDYHLWLDSFSNSLIDDFSYNKFLEKINWNNVKAIIRTTLNFKQIVN